MIGALADWFAVTALFRYPLGIPIPHTAIIPHRKDQIGRSLGEFVEGNFLTQEVLAERLAQARVGERLGIWLSRPANAARAGDAVADLLQGHARGARRQAGPGRARTGRARPHRRHPGGPARRPHRRRQRARAATINACSTPCSSACAGSSTTTGRRSGNGSSRSRPGGCRSRSTTGSSRRSTPPSSASSTRSRPTRTTRCAARSTVAWSSSPSGCSTTRTLLAKGEELKRELLEHPEVRAWLESLWLGMKDGHGRRRRRSAPASCGCGCWPACSTSAQRLASEPELRQQGRQLGRARRRVRRRALPQRGQRPDRDARSSAGTPRRPSRKVELQVGRDLQFIRINGTIVGGLAGVMIHFVSELFVRMGWPQSDCDVNRLRPPTFNPPSPLGRWRQPTNVPQVADGDLRRHPRDRPNRRLHRRRVGRPVAAPPRRPAAPAHHADPGRVRSWSSSPECSRSTPCVDRPPDQDLRRCRGHRPGRRPSPSVRPVAERRCGRQPTVSRRRRRRTGRRPIDVEGCMLDVTSVAQGDSGANVECVQKALTAAGFYSGAVDGVFSPALTASATSFQTGDRPLRRRRRRPPHGGDARHLARRRLVRHPHPAAGRPAPRTRWVSSSRRWRPPGDDAPPLPPDAGQGTGKRIVYRPRRPARLGDRRQRARSCGRTSCRAASTTTRCRAGTRSTARARPPPPGTARPTCR